MAKKFLSDIELDAGLVDANGNTGTSGQVLSSTGSATSWISQGDADKAKSIVLRVKNSTLSAMTKGQVICEAVSISPPAGNLLEVVLADNNAVGGTPALGILNEDLDASGGSNDEGDAIMFGKVSGIDTSAFSVGDQLFVSDTPGGLTTTKPTGVKYIQKVGVVIRDHSTNGTIEVFGAGRVNDVPTPLYVDHSNQRLGIGKTSPSSELHINNDSSSPELRLSYVPSGGYGGGGDITFEGGSSDYVYGSIKWVNGANEDATISYAAATRDMLFKVNQRNISTNGVYWFYNITNVCAKIQQDGIYAKAFYDLNNTAYFVDPASTNTALNAPLGSARVKEVYIGNQSNAISNKIWFNSGGLYQPGLYFDGNNPKFIINSLVNSIFHDSYHPNADTWTTARTITLGGDLTGSVSIDGSSNVTLSAQVNNNSHQHNVLYENNTITYGASHLQWMDINGNGGTGLNGSNPQNPTNDWHYHLLMNHANNNGYYVDLAFDFHDDNVWFQRNEAGTLQGWQQMFHDGYHPNADIWTTARTITIGSTGKSVNGSANVSWSLSEIGAAASSHTHTWADISGETANSVNGWGGLRHQTNDGYIDFGPANTGHAHIYTDRANFYLNKPLTVSGGSLINSSDIRANLFYDKNNTSYYVNPNGTSVMSQIYLDSWLVHNGDTDTFMGFADVDTIRFVTNYAERMEISNGGVVFGGGAAAAKPVHVATSDQGTARIRIENTNAGGDTFDLISGVHNVTQEGFSIYQENANATRLRIDDDGNVGINTNYPGQKLSVNGTVSGSIFYDYNNTGYFFNGDASKDGVDLVTGGNYAINVLGTISGGHRKHGNLETPEMQWSVGGSTDLNWKKLFDIVTSDASYSGWGAEIEITNFSGNFGNSMYSNGELYKGALSIYHWGGTGTTPETPYAGIPYDMRSHVRWYKIQESGKNRYELQVKSPGNYQQLYVKVKPGIGNQVADIISYANLTNGTTSGGTAYVSTQTGTFNNEFAGGIWTNDTRNIGWKNAYGSPYLSSYYGSITTSTAIYIGGPVGNGQDLYCDDLRSNKVFDRAATAYYFEGGNTGDSIRVAGDVVAYYSSDKRLKDNIKPIKNALDKVKAISGVTFEWNEKSHKTTGKKDVGVVAQEIEDVLPELVETRTNGYKAVDYQKLTAVLIESVKELSAKVEALEAKQCNCK